MWLIVARWAAGLVVTAHWARVTRTTGVLRWLGSVLTTRAEVARVTVAVRCRQVILGAVVARRASLTVTRVHSAHIRYKMTNRYRPLLIGLLCTCCNNYD